MKKLDLLNKRFGRLIIIEEIGKAKNGDYLWKGICDCRKIGIYFGGNLKSGHTQSCGCLQIERNIKSKIIHGFSKKGKVKKFYICFRSIIQRTTDKNCRGYPNYGGRGIKCLWKSFEEFRDDMLESYHSHIKKFGEKNTTIERIDNNGHYCKENCRWATKIEQQRNKRNTSFIKFYGKKISLPEFARIYNINYQLLWQRIFKQNWTIKKAINHKKFINQYG